MLPLLLNKVLLLLLDCLDLIVKFPSPVFYSLEVLERPFTLLIDITRNEVLLCDAIHGLPHLFLPVGSYSLLHTVDHLEESR